MNIVHAIPSPILQEIEKSCVLTVSSAHMTYQDRATLAALAKTENAFLTIADLGCGFLIRGINEQKISEAADIGFSLSFPQILKYALASGCDHLILEAEGAEIFGFNVYEW